MISSDRPKTGPTPTEIVDVERIAKIKSKDRCVVLGCGACDCRWRRLLILGTSARIPGVCGKREFGVIL